MGDAGNRTAPHFWKSIVTPAFGGMFLGLPLFGKLSRGIGTVSNDTFMRRCRRWNTALDIA